VSVGVRIRPVVSVARLSVVELFRRRDVYVALIFALVVGVPLLGANVFGVEGAVRYVRELVLLLVWVCSVAVSLTTAARQLPGEIQRRTILPLLARPVTRAEVVVGKWAGAAAASCAATLLLYGCYAALTALKSGGGGAGGWGVLAQSVALHLCAVLLICALAVLGSLVLTASANVTLSALLVAGMLLFGSRLYELAAATPGVGGVCARLLHWGLPHVELFDLRLRVVHGWEPLGAWVFVAILAYGLLYAASLVGAAALVFSRKRL